MDEYARDLLTGWDVLVVEDDPNSMDVADRILKHYAATVHLAYNGQEALALLETIHPKFIITDLSMPVMDGWELIRRLKSNPATREIPVIALTAHAMIGDRELAMAAGCHNYITKPLSVKSFISDLVGVLGDIPDFNFSGD